MNKDQLNPEAAGIAERVTTALANAQLSQAEATRRAQAICPRVIRTVLHKAARLGLRPRSQDVRAAFAQVLGVDPGYLWFGVGPARRPSMLRYLETDLDEEPDEAPAAPAPSPVPVAEGARDPSGYSIKVLDDRWEPLASQGDVLHLTPSFPPGPGDRVYVRDEKGDGVYRLAQIAGDMVTLISLCGKPATRSRMGLVIHRIAAVSFLG